MLINNARYLKPFFLGRRWINNQRKSNSVWYNTPHWKIIAHGDHQIHLNNRICQHCGVKTSKVTPSFYYIFNISLSCNNIHVPSFIGNLWWVLLIRNHLKGISNKIYFNIYYNFRYLILMYLALIVISF